VSLGLRYLRGLNHQSLLSVHGLDWLKKNTGVQIEADAMDIDIWSHVLMKNARLIYAPSSVFKIQANIGLIDLRYQVDDLLTPAIKITHAQIEHLSTQIDIGASMQATQTDYHAEPWPVQIAHFLTHSPAHILLNTLDIQALDKVLIRFYEGEINHAPIRVLRLSDPHFNWHIEGSLDSHVLNLSPRLLIGQDHAAANLEIEDQKNSLTLHTEFQIHEALSIIAQARDQKLIIDYVQAVPFLVRLLNTQINHPQVHRLLEQYHFPKRTSLDELSVELMPKPIKQLEISNVDRFFVHYLEQLKVKIKLQELHALVILMAQDFFKQFDVSLNFNLSNQPLLDLQLKSFLTSNHYEFGIHLNTHMDFGYLNQAPFNHLFNGPNSLANLGFKSQSQWQLKIPIVKKTQPSKDNLLLAEQILQIIPQLKEIDLSGSMDASLLSMPKVLKPVLARLPGVFHVQLDAHHSPMHTQFKTLLSNPLLQFKERSLLVRQSRLNIKADIQKEQQDYETSLEIPALSATDLFKEVPVKWNQTLHWQSRLNTIQTKQELSLANERLLALEAQISKWQTAHKKAHIHWQAWLNKQTPVPPPLRSLISPLSLDTPIELKSDVDVWQKNIRLDLDLQSKQQQLAKMATLKNFKAHLQTTLNIITTAPTLDWAWLKPPYITIESVQANAFCEHCEPLNNQHTHVYPSYYFDTLNLGLSIHTPLRLSEIETTPIVIDEMFIENGQKHIRMHMSGDLLASLKQAHLTGEFNLHAPQTQTIEWPNQPSLRLSGDLRLPWQLTREKKDWIALAMQMQMTNMQVQYADMAFVGINGGMSVSEQIKITKDNQIQFYKLAERNPFKRVDFNKLSPFLDTHAILKIASIRVGNRTLGPLHAQILCEQNLLTLDRLDAQLLNGTMTGQAFFNMHPAFYQLGVLGRISQLEVTQLLDKKSVILKKDTEKALISARLSMIYDINKSLLEGRMDFNQLGKRPLLAFLEYLDPRYQESSLNQIRTVLQVAYPTYVGAYFTQGMMDLDVTLAGIINQKYPTIHGVPVNSFLHDLNEQIKNALKVIPQTR